ncbi:MAG: outer membrane protein assembly factor BamD [Candidatus Omnitrophica bacterium]|nr:outer membrane protein assembly factor BamD [Candidatus Omnitrophota bacterium]
MIKKILVFCIVCVWSVNAYSFWVWSPKTQKWKNPKYSPLATPFLQFKEGEKNFDEKRYKEARDAFKKLIIHYPDSQEAAEAQYYLGRCLEEMSQPYQAFQEYQKVIDIYPNSKRINEAVEREYKIGEYFLNREPKQWLGVSVYDFVEHPSIEIFKKIVEKVPYSPYATQAQYKLGLLLMKLGRYDEAREAFQKVIDNYPDTEWATPSKYQLAIATSKASPGVGYDSTTLQEASSRLDEFIKKHPDAQISTQAEIQLKELRNKEARKNFNVAQFYENQEKYDSALIYYKVVTAKYADSNYYLSSLEKIKELTELTEGKISKKELLRRKLHEQVAAKKEERRDLQDERYLEKEKRIMEKLEKQKNIADRKKELRQKKIDKKKEAREKALKRKQELKEQKKRKREETLRAAEEALAQKEKQAQPLVEQTKEAVPVVPSEISLEPVMPQVNENVQTPMAAEQTQSPGASAVTPQDPMISADTSKEPATEESGLLNVTDGNETNEVKQ